MEKEELQKVSPDEEIYADKPAGSQADAKTLRMGTASVPKLLLEFAIPSIIGMLVNSAYNIISAAFLGQAVGEVGLAVTTAAFPPGILFMSLAMLVGNGGNALAALRLGQGRKDEAERVLGNTLTLAIIISVGIALLCNIPPCMSALLSLSSTTPAIYEQTRIYVWILSMGCITQIVGMGLNNFIRTAGAPNRALLTMVIGAVSCIGFNYLFVMVLGWGVPGSALATILGMSVSLVSVLWYFIVTPGAPLKLHARCLRLSLPLVKEILTLGLASFLLQIAACVSNVVVNYQLVKYGALCPIGSETALAAIGVVNRLANLAFMPIVGIAAAAQPLIGYNYGAGKIARVRKALACAVSFAFVIGVCMWLATRIWPEQIVSIFGVEDKLMDLTVFALFVQMLAIPLIGVQVIACNYFQATGQPLKSTVLSLTRQLLFLLPALFFMPVVAESLFGTYGLYGLYASWPFADFLSIFVSGSFLAWELRRLKRLERGELTDKYVGGGSA